MAIPDKQRKIKLFLDNVLIVPAPPRKIAIDQASSKIITVLIAVAKSVSTPFIPTFAKMAVSAAKKAESKAYIHHIIFGILNQFLSRKLNVEEKLFELNQKEK